MGHRYFAQLLMLIQVQLVYDSRLNHSSRCLTVSSFWRVKFGFDFHITNLVSRVSHLTAPWSERGETLIGSGHLSPRIWEMTIKLLKGWRA